MTQNQSKISIEKIKKYDDLSEYKLDKTKLNKILTEQRECVLSWVTLQYTPASCIVNYVYDDTFWITTTTVRAKYKAIIKNPNCCITVSSQGTSVLGDACATVYGVLEVQDNKDIKSWFYRKLSNKLTGCDSLVKFLDSENRVIMKLKENKIITYDGVKMAQDVFL